MKQYAYHQGAANENTYGGSEVGHTKQKHGIFVHFFLTWDRKKMKRKITGMDLWKPSVINQTNFILEDRWRTEQFETTCVINDT